MGGGRAGIGRRIGGRAGTGRRIGGRVVIVQTGREVGRVREVAIR